MVAVRGTEAAKDRALFAFEASLTLATAQMRMAATWRSQTLAIVLYDPPPGVRIS